MRIVFRRCMTQRYRAILHLVDPIIEAGHEFTVVVSDDYVDLKKYYKSPCDVSRSAPNTLKYLCQAFGLEVKHLDEIKYTKEKKPKADLSLCYDDQQPDCLGIPYNTWSCFWRGKELVVGNPMCELIKGPENENQCLIVHPGGGRGYVSPQRKEMSKERVTKNNIRFLQEVIDALPDTIDTVVIKAHPFPYQRCTVDALRKFVIPHLKTDKKLVCTGSWMVQCLRASRWIINFGGTTAIWLMGSDKRWFNIRGMDKYKASREKKIDERGGGTTLHMIKNVWWKDTTYQDRFNYPATQSIMGKITQCVSGA